jgi:hypothetical protein
MGRLHPPISPAHPEARALSTSQAQQRRGFQADFTFLHIWGMFSPPSLRYVVVDNQWLMAQDSSVNTGGFMEQVSSEMMKMLERMASQILRDGVTPEMFKQDMEAFTNAYMEDDLRKTERMTLAYFHNQQFRRDVIMATAEMAS